MFPLEKGEIIGGVVVDEDGSPIEGVKVEVRAERNDNGQWPRLHSWLAYGEDPFGALITDSEGRWSLNNVPAGDVDLRLKLSHPEYVDDYAWHSLAGKGVATASVRDQSAVIVMQRGVIVTGKVTDPNGNPVERAVVIWGEASVSNRDADHEFRTDANGTFRLPPLLPGPENVAVVANGWMPDVREIEISEGMAPIEFLLQPGKTLRIRVIDSKGDPVPGAYVYTERWRGGEWLYNREIRAQEEALEKGIPRQTDANGVYEWTWAPDDEVEYEFWQQGFAEIRAQLTADGNEHVQVMHPILQIQGRVTDAATGQPIERFTVVPVREHSPGRLRVRRSRAAEHRRGEFSIEFDDNQAVYRVRVEAIGYRTAISDPFEIGDAVEPCDFRLQPAPPVRGRVVDPNGNPAAGARVFLATKTQRLENHGVE